jgi:hypothetical protein
MKPEADMEEIHEILSGYGISTEASQMVADCLARDEENWIRVWPPPSTCTMLAYEGSVYDGL